MSTTPAGPKHIVDVTVTQFAGADGEGEGPHYIRLAHAVQIAEWPDPLLIDDPRVRATFMTLDGALILMGKIQRKLALMQEAGLWTPPAGTSLPTWEEHIL